MSKELNLSCHYKVLRNEERNSYSFKTNTGAEYEVIFIESAGIFTSTQIENARIYSLAINKTISGNGLRDNLVSEAISAIINDFFSDNDRILIYQCDTEDGRELVRQRMFKIWFENSPSKNNYIRLETEIDTGEIKYYGSLIHHFDNSIGASSISESFDEVIYHLREEK